ncbi:MAG TPA: VanZ family protein [Gemmatales bacterium]|nr:VanZ family protein [Gemmatales bacterium]
MTVMMIVVFIFGTDLFSSENTRPIVRWIMQWFLGERAWEQLGGSSEGWLRKSAHFLEYALLAYLWLRALRGDSQQRWKWSWFAIAFLATALWATVDELQQGYISRHRTGSAWDVLLDSSGGLTALMLVFVAYLVRPTKRIPSSTTRPEGNVPSSSAHQ